MPGEGSSATVLVPSPLRNGATHHHQYSAVKGGPIPRPTTPRTRLADRFSRHRAFSLFLPEEEDEGEEDVKETTAKVGRRSGESGLFAARRLSSPFSPDREGTVQPAAASKIVAKPPSTVSSTGRTIRPGSSGGSSNSSENMRLGARLGAFFQFRPGSRGRGASLSEGLREEKLDNSKGHLRSLSVPQPWLQAPVVVTQGRPNTTRQSVLIEGVQEGQCEDGPANGGSAIKSDACGAGGVDDDVQDKDDSTGANCDNMEFYHGRAAHCQTDIDYTPPSSSSPSASVPEHIDAHHGLRSPRLENRPSTPPRPRPFSVSGPPFSSPHLSTSLDEIERAVQPRRPHIDLESVSSTRSPNASNLSGGPLNTVLGDTGSEDLVAREEEGPPALETDSHQRLSFVSSRVEQHEEGIDTSNTQGQRQAATSPPPLPPPSPPSPVEEDPAPKPRELALPSPAVAMLSSSQQQASSVSASGHPPYRYAHLYPQPRASSSTGVPQLPHSHHGHGIQGISYLPQSGQVPSGSRQHPAAAAAAAGSSSAGVLPRSGFRVGQGAKLQQQAPVQQTVNQGHAASKANLKAWWNQFNFGKGKKDASAGQEERGGVYRSPDTTSPQNVVFGKPLKESLKYASVQISTANANGELYVWGYIPVVVAKCGLYLKENATEVPGTFRVNGSNRRMRELQAAFETSPRYGKNLDWKQETYTTHDVASVFRRYLTQMPEPVIPYDLYHQFRDALGREPINQEEVISRYKSLIRQMPRSNQYLLLYVLDLLSVFARKSDKNLMTATNLAVIFRPGLMSHPQHEMAPHEHALSQKVLEFLIAHQDWFMLDIPPPVRSGQTAQSSQQSQSQPQTGSMPTHERRPSDLTQQVPTPPTSAHQQKFVYPMMSSSSPPATPTRTDLFAFQQQMHQEQVSAGNLWLNPVGGAAGAMTNSPNVSSNGGGSASSPAAASRRARVLSEKGSETTVDDVMFISKGDADKEELSGIGGGGWKLVSRVVGGTVKDIKEKDRLKMLRRRSTMERSDLKRGSMLAEGDMSSALSPDDPISSGGPTGATVQRSRTLPSSRRKSNGSPNGSPANASELVLSASTGKENVGVVHFGPDNNGKMGAKEKRSVLLKKGRRGSSSVPGDHQQRTS